MKNNNEVMVGGAVVFKEGKAKKLFLLSKNNEGEWEILKSIVRRGESSVRAVIRYTSEQGNMSTRVLDEIGRANGTATVNSRTIAQKFIYYLMYFKAGAEVMGLGEVAWFDKEQAMKKITLKREKDMLKVASSMIKEWEKTHKKKKSSA